VTTIIKQDLEPAFTPSVAAAAPPSPAGFDPRADRHTRHTARLGGLDDFPVFDFCVFHDFTFPFLS
jgi:hypothetical protein